MSTMTQKRPKISIDFIKRDSLSLRAAARTVSLGFAKDPLIKWLQGGNNTWGELSPQVQKWQTRRMAWARLKSILVGAAVETTAISTSGDGQAHGGDKFAGVAIVYPPKHMAGYRWTSFIWIFERLKLSILDRIDRIEDQSVDVNRLEDLFSTHHNTIKEISARYEPDNMWYIEVVAVQPSSHGQGIGRKLVEWTLEQAGSARCFLECTDEKNVPFYEKLGFSVVEVVTLRDRQNQDDAVNMWCMVSNIQKP